jgi:hypothetical protein
MSKQRISILASNIVKHVLDEGGWLGASWPMYIRGPKLNHMGEYHAAYMLACERCWRCCEAGLMQVSQDNFEAASRGWDEVEL